jgi:uncharacterized membrane protein
VALTYFAGIVVVYNTANMGSAGAQSVIDYEVVSITNTWDLKSEYPTWGPRFNSKCIVGYRRMSYMIGEDFFIKFELTTKGNYEKVRNGGTSSPNGIFGTHLFCLSPGDY